MDPRVKSLGKFYEDDREERVRALGGIQSARQQDVLVGYLRLPKRHTARRCT